MNIQGIGQAAPVQSSPTRSDTRLRALDGQIAELQKSIQDVRKNEKLDKNSKAEKIKEYEQQIQMLQQEKVKIQAEERQSRQKPAESVQPPAAREAKAESDVVGKHVQNAFVKMDSFINSEKATGVVREQIKGEIRIAESKSYLRTPDPETAAKARGKLDFLNRTIFREASEAVGELDKAAEDSVSTSNGDLVEEESDREQDKSGTGRMEPGQFLDDEA